MSIMDKYTNYQAGIVRMTSDELYAAADWLFRQFLEAAHKWGDALARPEHDAYRSALAAALAVQESELAREERKTAAAQAA